MSKEQTAKAIGCTTFGLNQGLTVCTADEKQHNLGQDFLLESAVLPTNPFGRILTGKEAREERIHSGISWPPEAQVHADRHIRRVPIPYAWRGLVDAGDTSIRWTIENGVSFPVARILASHIHGFLASIGITPAEEDHLVIAIPNSLDEFGQEELLKELARKKIENVSLLWRPVAAALAWLDRLQGQLPDAIDPEDYLLVLYVGPDGVEVVPLRLRERHVAGRRYVIPLRDRPRAAHSSSGLDWAARILEEQFPGLDAGAFWHALLFFPEIWASIAQAPWKNDQLPRVWNVGGDWAFWSPEDAFYESAWSVENRRSTLLEQILNKSSGWPKDPIQIMTSWGDLLRQELRAILNSRPHGRLMGMIVCGPLVNQGRTQWLQVMEDSLLSSGLRLDNDLSNPHPRGVWMCTDKEDCVAAGSAIYGARRMCGLPTYLDTLPRLSILAESQGGKYDWQRLVDATEWDGGKEYSRPVTGRFELHKGEPSLSIFLKKEEEGRTSSMPYRKATFNFPAAPDKDTTLDLSVRMRPASGLAQLEILPHQPAFLHGRRVFLDYSTMVGVSELPEPQLCWPEPAHIATHPSDSELIRRQVDVVILSNTPCSSPHYLQVLEQRLVPLLRGRTSVEEETGERCYYRNIDQDGMASTSEGQELIQQIVTKLARDFTRLEGMPGFEETMEILHRRATWLYGATPSVMVEHLNEQLKRKWWTVPYWNLSAESASRCLTSIPGYSTLFNAIADRIKTPRGRTRFPINAARAICNVLMYREDGERGLTLDQAKLFSREAVSIMEEQAHEENYQKKFFQGALLFLILLRFRNVDRTFLDPDTARDRELFDRGLGCLRKVAHHFDKKRDVRAIRARELIHEIESYMYCRGSKDIILHLVEDFALTDD